MKAHLFLLIALLLTALVSCAKYPAKRSTREERRVVITLNLDGEKYKVKYELYRALFLNYKSLVDGGDSSVWSSDSKDWYIDRINEIIVQKASEIYAVFHLAEVDSLSETADIKIMEVGK